MDALVEYRDLLRAALAATAPATQDGDHCGHTDRDLFTNKRLRCNRPAGHDGDHGPWIYDEATQDGGH